MANIVSATRIYPTTKPDNWESTDELGYKRYYYLNDHDEPVSLASQPNAPTWVANKYFYVRCLGDFNNDGVINGSDAAAVNKYVTDASMCHDTSGVTEDDIPFGDVLNIGSLVLQDATAIQRGFSTDSVDARFYPKSQPAEWNDGTNPDGYKKYWYINATGDEVSLADDIVAPTWEDKKYFYKGHASDLFGADYLAPLVTHLP